MKHLTVVVACKFTTKQQDFPSMGSDKFAILEHVTRPKKRFEYFKEINLANTAISKEKWHKYAIDVLIHFDGPESLTLPAELLPGVNAIDFSPYSIDIEAGKRRNRLM